MRGIMAQAISVHNLSKTFFQKQKKTGVGGAVRSFFSPDYKKIEAVHNLTFSVDQGEMLAFIGPNGSGKSTTIKMITGILFPTSGTINVLGFTPSHDRTQLAYKIGTVFGQKSQLWYHLAAIDTFNLLSYMYELNRTDYQERLRFLVDAFEIAPFIASPIRKLSLGERMRCEIVASLLHRPQILFLDEPTIGLDVIAKQKVRDVLVQLNKQEGVTMFLTSHDAGDIEAITHRTIIINKGVLVFDGLTSELKKRYGSIKVVEFFVDDVEHKQLTLPGGRVVHQGKHHIKVEVNTEETSIQKLLVYALEHWQVRDISIEERPLEKIISQLYREQ